MRLSELIQDLEVIADNCGDTDPVVMLAVQPSWPLAHHVSGVRALQGDEDITEDPRVHWEKGDRLRLSACGAYEGTGRLKYPESIITAEEDGVSGGQDVFDGLVEEPVPDNPNDREGSFYGFSVMENLTAKRGPKDEIIVWISEGSSPYDRNPYAPKAAWRDD